MLSQYITTLSKGMVVTKYPSNNDTNKEDSNSIIDLVTLV